MHNIFLTESRLNSNRSNYKYVDETYYLIYKDNIPYISIDNNLIQYSKQLNYKNNHHKLFIPYAESRGIIVRSIAYMKYTYKDLVIENVIDIETIVKWNIEYPPTVIEKKQNEKIMEIQGNYNPFILDPELINEIYNKNDTI